MLRAVLDVPLPDRAADGERDRCDGEPLPRRERLRDRRCVADVAEPSLLGAEPLRFEWPDAAEPAERDRDRLDLL